MDMCYDGTLVMPSSYAVMNEEEMTYVEGGSIKSLVYAAVGGLFAIFAGETLSKSAYAALLTTAAAQAMDSLIDAAIGIYLFNPALAQTMMTTAALGLVAIAINLHFI